MSEFPRTEVGGVSLSRLIIGTNWFLGYSHSTPAKDEWIKETFADPAKIADVLEVFVKAGVDTIMGPPWVPEFMQAVHETEQRTGHKMIVVSTPTLPVGVDTPEKGLDVGEVEKVLDQNVEFGATFCMPHQGTTDALLDRCTRTIRHMDVFCRLARERNLIPGLSTHMPESIIYADETNLDVETYISMYNAMGFLMQVEVDWIQRVIVNAKHPVMTIKPLAAGQLRPFQALNFVWNTLRDCDMVTIGTTTAREAEEVIEMSLAILQQRGADVELQETRSKASIKSATYGIED